jgi:hypothetical protein
VRGDVEMIKIRDAEEVNRFTPTEPIVEEVVEVV